MKAPIRTLTVKCWDEIAELIVDTVCSARKTIRIAGNDYPAEVVKSRFMKLDSSHVQYVMGCMVFRLLKVQF